MTDPKKAPEKSNLGAEILRRLDALAARLAKLEEQIAAILAETKTDIDLNEEPDTGEEED